MDPQKTTDVQPWFQIKLTSWTYSIKIITEEQ